ncbi:MAG: hypothetical protein MR487_06050 [Lachnospiraceae bacterium]|nr:hypothetical protein [Lachnospiraceae bacterium]
MDNKENIKDTANKLVTIYKESPNDYYYLKGWIHCILQREYSLQKSEKQIAGR